MIYTKKVYWPIAYNIKIAI